MAKKILKRKPPLLQLFFLLLIPWIVMGVVAAVAYLAGMPDYAAILIALAASLVVTYYIRTYVQGQPRLRR